MQIGNTLIDLGTTTAVMLQVLGQVAPDSTTTVEQGTTTEGATAAGNAAASGGAAANDSGLLSLFLQNPLNLMMLAVLLFFLIVLWPQQRQMKAEQLARAKALADLKKNDRVITTGGIHGTVVQANSGESIVVIRIDESANVRMTVNRDAIATILTNKPAA
jgi:preprotein translocase subunit YajC